MEEFLFFPLGIPYDLHYRNSSTAYPVGPHTHNGCEIYFTLTELPDVLLGDQVFAVPAGTLIIIPPFCVHQLYHKTGVIYERYILSIQDTWLKNVLFDLSEVPPCFFQNGSPLILRWSNGSENIPDRTEKEKEFTDLFRKLLSYSNIADPSALSTFFELLAFITKQAKQLGAATPSLPTSASQKKINEIISYIQDHIREDLHIQDLAEHFYLHPDYLARLFKQHAHVSLGHYLTLQKIGTAQKLLREGMTVSAVSEELGYSSYAYFFKTFQKVTGISPSQYRNRYSAP